LSLLTSSPTKKEQNRNPKSKIQNHQSKISSIEREKVEKEKYYDQQIRHEQDEIRRHTKLIDELKRQI